jgi:hypothetical protein
MFTNRFARAVTASVAATVLGLTALAAPASAAVLVDDDYYALIVGPNVSFGSNVINPGPFAMNGDAQPGGYGRLIWWSDGGVIEPELVGSMWTQRIGGDCAKMRMQYFDVHGVVLATRGSAQECPSDDAFDIHPIDMAPFADAAIVRVVVSTLTKGASGNWVVNGSQTFYLN